MRYELRRNLRGSWFLLCMIIASQGQWVHQTTPLMPRASEQMAVGYFNDSIYLMFGLRFCSCPSCTDGVRSSDAFQ